MQSSEPRATRFDDVDYSQPPQPPLDPDDSAWASELLKGRPH
jgi:hypothetical protein